MKNKSIGSRDKSCTWPGSALKGGKKIGTTLLLTGWLLVTWASGLSVAAPPIQLGLDQQEAASYNIEFQKYSRMQPVYKENGIQASMYEFAGFWQEDWTEDKIYQMLKQYHVVQLTPPNQGITHITPEIAARAKVVSAALVHYVQDGGGLFWQPQPARFPGDEDEQYWNLVMAPFGVQILHEGTYDKTRATEGLIISKAMFWYTTNIRPHPVTAGVKNLYLPLDGGNGTVGLIGMRYSPEWQPVVLGEKEAKSYLTGTDNGPSITQEGTYKSEPPVLAVRQFGKGRIVCYPISSLFTGLNHRNPLWTDMVESKGDPKSGRTSDGMKLQMNSYHWLAEPSLQIAGFGTYQAPPDKPVEYPKAISQDGTQFTHFASGAQGDLSAKGVRGIVGAHTSYTDGKGSVADYVKTAKAAGLSFIVFSDPLEKLTPDTLAKLKADCKAASDASFYACPGIEFTDGIGNRWVFWGEKVVFPDKSFVDGNNTYIQWDGQRVNFYGQYMNACGFNGSALVDYKQLRANGAHPENLWWFYDYLPLAYDKDKLIADNYSDYLYGLRDLRWAALMSFTRIHEPSDVALAAQTCFTQFGDLASAQKGLNTNLASFGLPWWSRSAVSQGPVIAAWEWATAGIDAWAQTRGVQRVRMHFVVRSDAGIADVKVHDADLGIFRRFDGHGAKELDRDFEMVDNKEHWIQLEVTDTAGKRAFSEYQFIYSYKQGLFRCGDNLNILGATSMIWHPDRNQMLPLARDFQNGYDFALDGFDTGSPICPAPYAYPQNTITLDKIGTYPDSDKMKALAGAIMDLVMSSTNIQIVTMHMNNLSQISATVERPVPALATVPKDLGENEYFERTDTIYSPVDRIDWMMAWDLRRGHEARRNYHGSFIWHEGEIRFKKDVTLAGPVPIPLASMTCPTDLEKHWGDTVIVTDANGTTRKEVLQDIKKPITMDGHIRPGGYASQMAALVGYQGFLAPHDSDFTYSVQVPGAITIGLGHSGQAIKAGTVLKYQFAVGAFTDTKKNNELLDYTVHAFNMGGGHDGYPIEMKVGEIADATFFFTAKAKDNEASFKLGPKSLIIDLPIRVKGLEDNGCAAIFSTKRSWFRFVPVVGDAAYFQEPIEEPNEIWAGNIFVADNKALKITVVVDGQAEGKPPFVEVHNPTDAPVTATIVSPKHTPLFGGISAQVTVPAGDSKRFTITGQKLEPLP